MDNFDNIHFPHLKNTNFFVSDFFDEESEINVLQDFDCIIGNPPWFKATGKLHLFEKYCSNHKIPIANRQIAEAFIPRSKDFIKSNGLISLIVTSKILYNLNDFKFRQYLLKEYQLIQFFDLTLVRNSLFKNANWPAVIIFYKIKEDMESVNDNKVTFISLKPNRYLNILDKIFIESRDFKFVTQQDLKIYDWLFKTLLVGNSLDYAFIKRLKEEFISLGKFIDKHPTIKSGVGFKKSTSNRGIDAKEFKGLPYLSMSGNDLKRYSVKPSKIWEYSKIQSGNKELMNPPLILVKQSFSPTFDFISGFSDKKLVFDYNTLGIKGSKDDIIILKNMMAGINSNLFKYFFLMTGNVGIEKNRSSASEKRNFPLSNNLIFSQSLYNYINVRESIIDKDEIYIFDEKINNLIFDLYDVTDFEKDLINYAIDVTTPLITKGYVKEVNNNDLKEFIKIFFKSLEKFFKPKGLVVDVHKTDYFIALKFNIVDNEFSKIRFCNDNDIKEILNIFGIVSYDNIGEIFIQKDIKIVNESSFAIIKTIDYTNWHEAIAWYDVSEFLQLMYNRRFR